MHAIRISIAALLALLFVACAGIQGGPSAEQRQALAPSGKLRVGLLDGNSVHALRNPATGEIKGVSHDLGKALAERLGVPFEPILYPTIAAVLEGAKAGAWDVSFIGMNTERSKYLDFTATHLEVEYGYLVPAASKLAAVADVDRPGVRVAVVAKGSPDAFLTGALKSATLVRTPAIDGANGALALLGSQKADAIGGLKPNMYSVSAKLPGSRVLDGRPGAETAALAIPKGRSAAALDYARRFVEEAKSDGTVKAAIERAGLRGLVVAPPS
jgi:polar amino acid transport system substrate-binding protein